MDSFTLADLEAIVARRAASGDAGSYTRSLVAKGMEKCAKKLGEEAVEAALSAVLMDRKGLTGEAADVLYHLMVVLHVAGIPLADVMAELSARTRQTGLQEKASRPAGA